MSEKTVHHFKDKNFVSASLPFEETQPECDLY